MTRVIHIRDSKKTPDETYIGRPGAKAPKAEWGNPVVCNKRCPVCGDAHTNKGSTLACYETYLRARLSGDAEFYGKFWALRGRTLVCFCAPSGGFGEGATEICHGQVMARILDTENPLTNHPLLPTNGFASS